MSYKVLDLFSGIGGFSLGLEAAGMETSAFCEINPFCRMILKKHWPDVPIFEDVVDLKGESVGSVDVICGGFPCQDVSVAGLRGGVHAARSGLYSHIIRLACELRPRYIIMENVAALLNSGLATVLRDLAGCGYDAEWYVIPACAVGLPHERRRVWIIAYPNSERLQGGVNGLSENQREGNLHASLLSALALRASYCMDNLPQPCVVRGNDGVPYRAHRTRALGNSIVPAIAEIIGRAIVEHENLF